MIHMLNEDIKSVKNFLALFLTDLSCIWGDLFKIMTQLAAFLLSAARTNHFYEECDLAHLSSRCR